MRSNQDPTPLTLFPLDTHEKSGMKPFVKWPGGKSQELEMIWNHLPTKIDRFYEPFVGGGAVYFAMPDTISHFFINDKSQDLTAMYRFIQTQNKEFLTHLEDLNQDWKAIQSHFSSSWYTLLLTAFRKQKEDMNATPKNIDARERKQKKRDIEDASRMRIHTVLKEFDLSFILWNEKIAIFKEQLQKVVPKKMITIYNNEKKKGASLSKEDLKDMLLTSVKQSFYDYMRVLHNEYRNSPKNAPLDLERASCVYYFIRMFCYSSMFRYNAKGGFNVPYGGKSYNNNNFDEKIRLMKMADYQHRLQSTVVQTGEYDALMTRHKPMNNDFIFLDPPYDSEFSTYDENIFMEAHQKALANFLIDNFRHFLDKWLCYFRQIQVDDHIHLPNRFVWPDFPPPKHRAVLL